MTNSADRKVREYSKGMQQRIGLAQALIHEPELVFLDEPSAGLDPVMASDLDELIVTLSKTLGLTVVIVTHELESIFRVADRVVMLDKETKTIIATGDPKALKTSEDPRVRSFFNRGKKES